jgi:hypothetical protein
VTPNQCESVQPDVPIGLGRLAPAMNPTRTSGSTFCSGLDEVAATEWNAILLAKTRQAETPASTGKRLDFFYLFYRFVPPQAAR